MTKALPIITAVAAFGALFIPGIGIFISAGILAAGGIASTLLATTPSFPAQNRTQTLREAITTRKLSFGELVLGGKLSFYDATEGHEFHHIVITLGDAPVAPWDGIDIVWLDDTPILNEQIDGSGNVIAGKFANNVRIKKHLGGPSQTADTDLIAEISRLDTDFKGVGIAYVYIRLNWDAGLFPSGLPKVKVWARTNTVLDTRDSVRRFSTNAALVVREYLTEPELGLGYVASDFNDTITNASANTCDEIVDTLPVGHAVIEVDTANDELDVAVAGTGAPVRFETGDRVELFTDGAAPAGLSVATSYYVIVERLVSLNWKDSNESTVTLDAGDYSDEAATAITAGDVDVKFRTGIQADHIQATVKFATTFVNAMARTAIDITDAGTGQHLVIKTGEPRFAAAGVIDTAVLPKPNIDLMLTAMAGKLVWTGGVFHILAGAWRTPLATGYDESDLWGPIDVQTRHSGRERFNAVRGVLATLIAVGETTDYPPVIGSSYVTDDGGDEIWLVKDFPWTSRVGTAQRLASIELERHRREIRQTFPTGPQGFRAIPGSILKISNARRSWDNKTWEVMRQVDSELPAEGKDSPPLQGVTMTLNELDATVYDWNASTQEGTKAPVPALLGGNPLTIDAPTGLVLTSGDDELFVNSDGTVVSRLKVAWTVADFFADRTEVQFKPSADSDWQPVGLVQTASLSVHIWDVEDGISYDVRARSISDIGVRSDWLTGSHTVVGKTSAPPDVTTFNVTRMADGTRRFTWTATPPADVTSGGGFKLKFVAGTGGAWAGMAEMHTGLLAASPHETNELAAGSYTFGLKMVDSSGNESDNAAIIEATLGDPRLRDVLLSRDEFALGWPGTLVDCFISNDGILESVSAQTINDLPSTIAALPATVRSIVNSATPITYTTPTIDLGSDVTVTPIVSADPNTNATITMQVGTDADGAPVGSFIALAQVTVRYFKIKDSDAATDPFIRSMVILFDAETQVEDYEDVDTSGITAGRFETIATGHFKLATRGNTASITSATIRAFQNAGSGWTWDLLSKATTITADSEPAIEVKIYKDGVLTDAIIDVEIKGPKK